MTSRLPFADRLTGIPQWEQEKAGPMAVLLCELIAELIEATDRQSTLLAESLGRSGSGDGPTRDGRTPAVPAPTDVEGEGGPVQLCEPDIPPADPDETGGRPSAKPAGRPPGRPRKATTAAAKTAAQTTPPGGKEGTP